MCCADNTSLYNLCHRPFCALLASQDARLMLAFHCMSADNTCLFAANLLKPMLARGELRCIGATTLAEHRQHMEKDAAFERRFQQVLVGEPSVQVRTWQTMAHSLCPLLDVEWQLVQHVCGVEPSECCCEHVGHGPSLQIAISD